MDTNGSGFYGNFDSFRNALKSQGYEDRIISQPTYDGHQWVLTEVDWKSHVQWLLQDVQPGDSLVTLFAGHGNEQLIDIGDVKDNYPLSPQNVQAELYGKLPKGVNLLSIFRACYSGTFIKGNVQTQGNVIALSNAASYEVSWNNDRYVPVLTDFATIINENVDVDHLKGRFQELVAVGFTDTKYRSNIQQESVNVAGGTKIKTFLNMS
jgi:hypothetical protein